MESSDFRNVCFPCSHFLQAIDERNWNSESPCSSNRSSATSTSSGVSSSCKTEHTEQTSPNELDMDKMLTVEPVEPSVLNVGAKAQLRRRNSSVSRRRPRQRSIQVMSTPHNPTEEWSETFVAQDGVLTTNFCSTDL